MQHCPEDSALVSPELNPIPVVKSPWFHLSINFIGPISSAGNQYILTVSDYFTKFVSVHALPTKEAVSAMAFNGSIHWNVVKLTLVDCS